MSTNVKVSVIVPIYNVENYLERCLESLVKQTLEEIQIILVDDGSPDGSAKIINDFAQRYPQKILALSKENGGLSDARNFGIPYAEGEYIGFVDSDDYLDITMYEKLYKKAEETEADIVVCGYYGINEEKGTYKYLQKGNVMQFDQNLHENPKLLYTNAPYAWNKIFRKKLFLDTEIRFPKGHIYEDIATVYPLMLYANKVSKVDEALYYYILKRKGAITSTFSPSILQMYSSLAIMNDYYLKEAAFGEFEDVLGFINLKHTILRFWDFVLYDDRKLQFRMVKEGFKHLNKYFTDWKHNKIFFDFYFKKKKHMKFWSKYKMTWYLYSLLPNAIIFKYRTIRKICKKVKKVFTNKSYRNKYRYVKKWRKSPIVENRVLFESFHGTALNDSPFAMMKELAKDPSFEIYYTSKKGLRDSHQKLLESYGLKNVRLVELGSKKYQDILATSKFLINNVSFPPYFMKRQDQIYLNTWHGTPLKTLGKKMSKGIQDMSNMQRNFLHASYLLHPNEYTMNHMMEDYNLTNLYTGQVLLSGYPRNSIFLDENAAQEVRRKYSLNDKEVFAYMPTWRGAMSINANNLKYEDEIENILTNIDRTLKDNQIMYVNLHPLVKDKISISGYERIKVFPEDTDVYAFLNAVDVLITDYSSVFFDYSISKKPIVLFMYDFDAYMEERGMYLDIKELPFEKIYNLEDMLSYLENTDKSIDPESDAYKEYYNKFLKYDSVKNTEIINQFIFYKKQMDENLCVFDYSRNRNQERTVYLSDKIRHKEDMDALSIVDSLKNPIAIFLRKDFTSHTLEILNDKYNSCLDYTVIDTQMFMSFRENMKVYFARKKKKYSCDEIYEMEWKRILPNIKIGKVIVAGDIYRNRSLKHAIDKKNSENLGAGEDEN